MSTAGTNQVAIILKDVVTGLMGRGKLEKDAIRMVSCLKSIKI